MGAIEDIALDLIGGVAGGKPSTRQAELRPYLPTNYFEEAAQMILDHPGRVMILTGFFIPKPYTFPLPDGGLVEFDGPIGAYGLGEGLRRLDFEVTYVSDKFCTFAYKDVPGAEDYVEFPITGFKESSEFALKLLDEKKPSIVVATERCGVTAYQRYHNGRGWDISEFTAKLDALMDNHPHTIGIGDNGNEMGLGNFAGGIIETIPHPRPEPTITRSTKPLLGCSSDWGCYGLLAALSKLTKRDVLPTGQEVGDFIRQCSGRGMLTGSGQSGKFEVDGRPIEHQVELLGSLRRVLKKEGIATRE